MPKFQLETLEDYYTYYVQILGIQDYIFWHMDIPFLKRIVENKSAYDDWLRYAIEKERERSGKK